MPVYQTNPFAGVPETHYGRAAPYAQTALGAPLAAKEKMLSAILGYIGSWRQKEREKKMEEKGGGPLGAGVGGAGGAIIGGLIGGPPGAAIGAGLGAQTGGAIGTAAKPPGQLRAAQDVMTTQAIASLAPMAGGIYGGVRGMFPTNYPHTMPGEPSQIPAAGFGQGFMGAFQPDIVQSFYAMGGGPMALPMMYMTMPSALYGR